MSTYPAGKPPTPDLLHSEPLHIRVRCEFDVPHAVATVQDFCLQAGASTMNAALVATAASELANNLWIHTTHGGELILRRVHRLNKTGIELQSVDRGPGIADIELAMTEGFSTAGGMGCGLPGVKRLMDTFDITSQLGQGTHVQAVKWLDPVPPPTTHRPWR